MRGVSHAGLRVSLDNTCRMLAGGPFVEARGHELVSMSGSPRKKRHWNQKGRIGRAGDEAMEARLLLSSVALDLSGGAGGVSNTGFTAVLPKSGGTGLVSSNLAL